MVAVVVVDAVAVAAVTIAGIAAIVMRIAAGIL